MPGGLLETLTVAAVPLFEGEGDGGVGCAAGAGGGEGEGDELCCVL